MSVTPANLRSNFPAFANVTDYPDSSIQFWLDTAGKLLNASRWATLLDLGTQLFACHNLALDKPANDQGANGAAPVGQPGAVSSKSVDKVSVSYDVQSSVELDAGHWNMTVYGRRFIHTARMIGAGPLQVGAPSGVCDPLSSVNAWPGPDTYPGWFG